MKAGKKRFPDVESIFEGLQNDYFPFEVKGDCLYGANRTDGGWWLWVFNNKGVTKFTDAPHTLDHSFDVDIAVTYPGASHFRATELLTGETIAVAGGSFRHRIAAGDLAVFEIASQQSTLKKEKTK